MQEKELRELKQLQVILQKKISDYDLSEAHKIKVLNQIAGESRKTGLKNQWSKLISICRNFLK